MEVRAIQNSFLVVSNDTSSILELLEMSLRSTFRCHIFSRMKFHLIVIMRVLALLGTLLSVKLVLEDVRALYFCIP
jgi:hypothetical protein